MRYIALFIILIFLPSAHAEDVVSPTDSTAELNQLFAQGLGMVTGLPTGTYYQFGHDIKQAVAQSGVSIVVKESTGSVDNINRINSRENATFGIVQSDVLGFLRRAQEPESQKIAEKLRLVFPFYNEEVHVIAHTSIKSFDDLKGKRVVVGPKGSGSWLTSMNLFALMQVKPGEIQRLTPAKGLVAVLQGDADAMIFVAGKPVKLFSNLEQLEEHQEYSALLDQVHFIPLNDARLQNEYQPASISPSDYSFVATEVPTVAVTAVLVSFDFSEAATTYGISRCNDIRRFSDAVSQHISELKDTGHPKWQEVNLNAEVGIWQRDGCASSQSATATLEDELLNTIEMGF